MGPNTSKLPLPPMLMVDRIIEINEDGGKHGKGSILAELDINDENWFFHCHFKEDPVTVSYTHLTLPTNREV